MNNIKNILLEHFDLEDATDIEKKDFLQDVSELIMQKILRKAWADLDLVKRKILTELLAKVDSDPENEKKRTELFSFLDDNLVDIDKIIKNEVENMRTSYLELRDSIRDSV